MRCRARSRARSSSAACAIRTGRTRAEGSDTRAWARHSAPSTWEACCGHHICLKCAAVSPTARSTGRLGDISFEAPQGSAGTRGAQPVALIRSRIAWKGPIHGEDFTFVRARTTAQPKITIPGPCALHFRGGDAAVTAHAYRDVDQFWDDVVAAFQSELRSLAAAGCSYVQIDETAFAKFGDADVQATLRARGDDPDELIGRYIAVTNRVVHDLPTLRIGMHLCRGNRGGQWHAEGSYEAVAEKLFNQLAIDLFLLEYDTPRAGDFSPLRFVPNDKSIVLGLVSTKTDALEAKSELKRRIEEA